MHIDYPTLGIWFLAAIGFFVAGHVVIWTTGWDSSDTLVYAVVYALAQWIFVTGFVRSVSSWSLPLCWAVSFAVYAVICLLIWCLHEMLSSADDWWDRHKSKK